MRINYNCCCTRRNNSFCGFDDTHQNRFGSYLFARFIARQAAELDENIADAFLKEPSKVTACPEGLLEDKDMLLGDMGLI